MSEPLKEPLSIDQMKGYLAALKEETLSEIATNSALEEQQVFGLPAADSIEDRSITTFSRGELPHYAGINTLLRTCTRSPDRADRLV